MKTPGLRELKARLSSLLRDIARGGNRGRARAERQPPQALEVSLSPEALRYRRLVEQGRLRPAATPGLLDWSSAPQVRLRHGTAQALLDAEREE